MCAAISDNKYMEIKDVFRTMENNQAIVVTLLALERLWHPFIEGVVESEFPEEMTKEVLNIAETWMHMAWARVQRGNSSPEDLKNFKALLSRVDEMFEEIDGDYFAGAATFFYSGFLDCANWFFNINESSTRDDKRADVPCLVLDMITDQVVDTIINISPNTYYTDKKQCENIQSHHPMVIAEIERLDSDIALAKEYPQNLKLIEERAKQYRNTDFKTIQPLSFYGISIAQ